MNDEKESLLLSSPRRSGTDWSLEIMVPVHPEPAKEGTGSETLRSFIDLLKLRIDSEACDTAEDLDPVTCSSTIAGLNGSSSTVNMR